MKPFVLGLGNVLGDTKMKRSPAILRNEFYENEDQSGKCPCFLVEKESVIFFLIENLQSLQRMKEE
jgi:hypothetical protein